MFSVLLKRFTWAGPSSAYGCMQPTPWLLLSRLSCQLLPSLLGLDQEMSLALLPSQPSGLAAWGSDWQAQMTAPSLLVLFESGDMRKLSIEQRR